MSKMQTGNLLIENLGQDINTNIKLARSLRELNVLLGESLVLALVQHDLSKDLVGEGTGHDKRRVAGGTTQVDKTALGEKDDVSAVLHEETVDLGLDGDNAGSVGLEPSNVNFTVKVTNVYSL